MAFWIPAALSAGATALNYYNTKKNKPPAYRDTEAGKYLSGVREDGVISSKQRGGLLANTGAIAGNQASQRKADIRGGLVASGMNNSIAGARALDAPGRDTQRALTDTGVNLDIMNERSKSAAGRELAFNSTKREDERRNYSLNANRGLMGGLAGAGVSAYSGLLQQNALAEDTRRWDITSAQRDRQLDNQENNGAPSSVEYPVSLSNMNPRETAQWASDNNKSLAETKQLQVDMRVNDIRMQLEASEYQGLAENRMGRR